MLGAPRRPCGSVVAWRRADRTAEFSSLLSRRKSAGNRFSCCSLVPSDYWETVLVRVLRFSSIHIARGDTTRSFPPSPSAASHRGSSPFHIDSAKDTSRHPIAFHRSGDTAVYTPRRSSDTQRCHSPFPTGGESISSVPTRSSVQLLPVGVWLAWNGFAPFSPSSSPQSPLVDAASALVLLLRSCHRAAHHSFSCSPPTAPPSSSSSPLLPFVQSFSFPLVHVLPRILVLTPQRIRRTPSGSAVHFARSDRGWFRRLSSLAIRHQEGVSGSRVVQAFTLTRYPPPGRRIGTPSGPCVRQGGVSRPRLVLPFIFTRYPPPGRRTQTPSGPAVHLHSLSAARKAYPDCDCSR